MLFIVFFLKRCWSSGTNNLEDELNMMFEPVSLKEYQDKQDYRDLFIEVYKEPEKEGKSFLDWISGSIPSLSPHGPSSAFWDGHD